MDEFVTEPRKANAVNESTIRKINRPARGTLLLSGWYNSQISNGRRKSTFDDTISIPKAKAQPGSNPIRAPFATVRHKIHANCGWYEANINQRYTEIGLRTSVGRECFVRVSDGPCCIQPLIRLCALDGFNSFLMQKKSSHPFTATMCVYPRRLSAAARAFNWVGMAAWCRKAGWRGGARYRSDSAASSAPKSSGDRSALRQHLVLYLDLAVRHEMIYSARPHYRLLSVIAA
jgi:hypothetical protein